MDGIILRFYITNVGGLTSKSSIRTLGFFIFMVGAIIITTIGRMPGWGSTRRRAVPLRLGGWLDVIIILIVGGLAAGWSSARWREISLLGGWLDVIIILIVGGLAASWSSARWGELLLSWNFLVINSLDIVLDML